MQHLFYQLGIEICNDTYTHRLYVIHNKDNSARWIWNSLNPNPDFLNFYNVSGIKPRLFNTLIKFVFRFKMQHLFFKRSSIRVVLNSKSAFFYKLSSDFALFTGTEGPNRKLVLYHDNSFTKIALNESTIQLLENEHKHLLMEDGEFYKIPKILFKSKEALTASNIGIKGKRITEFNGCHSRALEELYNRFGLKVIGFNKTNFYGHVRNFFNQIDLISASPIPKYLKQNLEILANQFEDKYIVVAWSHGDFTPWNMYVSNEKVHLYDFELASEQRPFAFDVFHFVMQQGVLVERLSWDIINKRLYAAYLSIASKFNLESDYNTYLKAYLLVNVSYYIQIYSRQEKWHTQIYWLLETWNVALCDVLQSEIPHRKLMIGSIFDYLLRKDYATLKFPNISPTDLGPNSDIDILLDKPCANSLVSYLIKHVLVKDCIVTKRSNMQSALLLLRDDSLLALDLIHSFKRKSLVFMDFKDAIANSEANKFGINVLNKKMTIRYLQCFYGLNNAPVPTQYSNIMTTDELELPMTTLFNEIRYEKANKGFGKLKNKLLYMFDSFKLFANKGFIVTFSGVDGAGKSTVIEHTKEILIKQFRKEVVVLRHRPSILPILSTYVHGKEKAQQNVIQNLPRKGGNKSLLSSFFRFTYYYLDYLIGQFVIYFRYLIRGKIVLYDRYYFDFINDSLRSNIVLPKKWIKMGYIFLLKPEVNFFLYAESHIILSRKKELNEKEIDFLTGEYKELFEEYKQKGRGEFLVIRNVDLKETIGIISMALKRKIFNNV